MRYKTRMVLTGLCILVITVLVVPHIPFGKVTASPGFSNCAPISRYKYPFRHWTWSGIFPLEGGFVPDPHFVCSELVSLPQSIRTLIGDPNAKFQIISVNEGFSDYSSEILLIIQFKDKLLEFKLPAPQTDVAVFAEPMYPEARLFPFNGEIAVLTHFMETKQIYLISLPLNPRQPIIHHAWKQVEASKIANELKYQRDDLDLRQHFCKSPSKPFIAFYEKFAGSCSPVRTDTHDISFNEFW